MKKPRIEQVYYHSALWRCSVCHQQLPWDEACWRITASENDIKYRHLGDCRPQDALHSAPVAPLPCCE